MNPNLEKFVADAKARLGEPTVRREYGHWIPLAFAVRALVERGYSVTESVREVLVHAGIEINQDVLNLVRVTYYKVKKRPWPDDMAYLGNREVGNPVAIIENSVHGSGPIDPESLVDMEEGGKRIKDNGFDEPDPEGEPADEEDDGFVV